MLDEYAKVTLLNEMVGCITDFTIAAKFLIHTIPQTHAAMP